MPALQDETVLIICRGSGIARAVALAVSQHGGRVAAAGLHPDDLATNRGAYIGTENVHVTDERSIAALAAVTNGFLTLSVAVDGASTLSRRKGQADMNAIRCSGQAAVAGAIEEADNGLPEREYGLG
jgi:NAD(P)-dependent dehydrogenase (short-subunit alcohol dehydrogenase family)